MEPTEARKTEEYKKLRRVMSNYGNIDLKLMALAMIMPDNALPSMVAMADEINERGGG